MDDEHKISPEVTLSESTTDTPIESFTAEEMEFLKSYFERYAQEMLTSFQQTMYPCDDLPTYLLHRFKESKELLSVLGKPWSKYIPMLHEALGYYMIHVTDNKLRIKAMRLSTELMSTMASLSQTGFLVNRLCAYYSSQSKLLSKYMAEAEEKVVEIQK